MAKNSRSVKGLLAVAVVLLYFIPFYQTYFSKTPSNWNNLEVTDLTGEQAQGSDTPYFKENFVNQARPGLVCHVSSLAAAGDQRLMCTWYAGSREGAPDVAIYQAFYNEDEGTWTEPKILLDREQAGAELRRWVGKLGNAVVINDGQGRLWLFYASLLGGWSTASLNYKMSLDGGQTWSDSEKLILSPFFNLAANVKNNGVPLSRGNYLLPVYQEFLYKFGQVLLLRSNQFGLSYQIRRMSQTGRTLQPVLIPQDSQHLVAFFRNAAAGGENYILRAESRDTGRTWSEPIATTLPNPNSGFDMVRLPGGDILGAINYAFQDRSDLTLVISRDGGRNWQTVKVLENSPGQEYSYPFFLRSRGHYHLTYTYERERIKQVVFNEAWLKGKQK
ncbi:MAG: sialidase family protein [Thermodesulfobacteriota bacterium]